MIVFGLLSLYVGVRYDDTLLLLTEGMDRHDDFDSDEYFDLALYLVNHGFGSNEGRVNILCKACDWGELDVVKELVKQHKVDPNGECCYTVVHL